MREANFSIPTANKAAVSITTALYDRRALDCTSTLPLINSLNNLAYLTTSSGRIRDILTVDGGVERLVCILKEGRSKDMMEMWKWNLAFQCIVNIGVRGTEAVRTRVVEADMVPVIATILDNYWQVIEKCRERVEAENRRKCTMTYGISRSPRSSARVDQQRSERPRRHLPPPISIPENASQADGDVHNGDATPTGPVANISLSSPPERTTFTQSRDHNRQAQHEPYTSVNSQTVDPPLTANAVQGGAGLRPVRHADRLPSMNPILHINIGSNPVSPTTPGASVPAGSGSVNASGRTRRRPPMREQLSMSGSDDEGQMDESSQSEDSADGPVQQEPVVGIQADIEMRDIVDDDTVLDSNTDGVTLAVQEVSSADDETFNITHPASTDGSQANMAATPTQAQTFPVQPPTPANPLNPSPPSLQQTPAWYQSRSFAADRSTPATVLAAMPRDDDVLMSLQLLAFVSKYCNLRSYFQKTHLVPRLKIGDDLRLLDPGYNPATHRGKTEEELYDEWDNEFVEKPGEVPYNIFPLIEKFTTKPSSSRHATAGQNSPQQSDMQYWAGVVMRNLCRKDEKRGIRQCAYWQCGKWEEYQRQFAKCRRCRRTKYCSKECQKGAWGSHRFWCIAADPRDEHRDGHGHGHSHSHSHGHSHGHSHHHGNGEGSSGERSNRHHHRSSQYNNTSNPQLSVAASNGVGVGGSGLHQLQQADMLRNSASAITTVEGLATTSFPPSSSSSPQRAVSTTASQSSSPDDI